MKHCADGGTPFTVRICPLDHHNPPDFPRCRVCGGVLDAPMQVASPKLGWVRSTDQQTVELTGELVVGRAPETHGREGVFSLTTPPEILEISRTHARICTEGWEVTVEDLGSDNGTRLCRATGQIVDLQPHKRYNIQPGDVLELAPNYLLRFAA
ncbi:FHA domain-containing protein [Mobiluncus curtisii]|uniref:FHA domain-containing protein n=1 Tax=Mobiluncus curtisii TaxID=2051 RepID=UPI00146FF65F|nr:FHA domain-containing protein [Mobiluncus curtisii]NMW88820.1 FHA domain-containing protein [Mobiluncus curtisii]